MRHTLGDPPKFSRLTRVKILSGDKIAPMRDFRLLSGSFIIVHGTIASLSPPDSTVQRSKGEEINRRAFGTLTLH